MKKKSVAQDKNNFLGFFSILYGVAVSGFLWPFDKLIGVFTKEPIDIDNLLFRVFLLVYTFVIIYADYKETNKKTKFVIPRYGDFYAINLFFVIVCLLFMSIFIFLKFNNWVFALGGYLFFSIFWNLMTKFRGHIKYAIIVSIMTIIIFTLIVFFPTVLERSFKISGFIIYFKWIFLIFITVFPYLMRVLWVNSFTKLAKGEEKEVLTELRK